MWKIVLRAFKSYLMGMIIIDLFSIPGNWGALHASVLHYLDFFFFFANVITIKIRGQQMFS